MSWRTVAAALLLTGCATFEPRPLDPDRLATEFHERSLSDPALREFAEKNGAPERSFPPATWDLEALTLVALYYHPDLDVARAALEGAEARVVTAGARPNPTLSLSPELSINPLADETPWTLALQIDVPVEMAGKRGYRIEQARELGGAARIELAEAAWRVRTRLRAALVEHLVVRSELEAARAEEGARAAAVSMLDGRLRAGEISILQVESARSELLTTSALVRSLEGKVAETRAALAAALGVPLAALGGVTLDWPALEYPPGDGAELDQRLRSEALANRLDMRQALREYAAVEAELRLEIAKQYPDLNLGPGYTYDQSQNKFVLGAALTLPILNQNQGPIAEARTRRKETAARFLALQAEVIGETERALAAYHGALGELREAERSLSSVGRRERSTKRALAVGEEDRLAVAAARAATASANRGRWVTLRRVQIALGALEDVLQRPLVGAGTIPEPSVASPREAKR